MAGSSISTNKAAREEDEEIRDRKAGSSRVIHEVIRLEGEEELARPVMSLLLSGLIGGVAMAASLLASTYLRASLPDVVWRRPIEALGYPMGFIIVVMGRLQLFTESNVTAVLPVAAAFTPHKVLLLLRLWGLVFVANMAGTLAVSLFLTTGLLLSPPDQAALMEIAREAASKDFLHTLVLAVPSGFLVGTIAWILPNARENQIWVVFIISYLIGLGGLSHVVVGSMEAWLMWLQGGRSLDMVLGSQILPSLLGNMIGGSGLFAVLSHGQVRGELE